MKYPKINKEDIFDLESDSSRTKTDCQKTSKADPAKQMSELKIETMEVKNAEEKI